MQQSHLIIVAGCNGAGKSTYSNMLVDVVVPFDYDKRFLEIYDSLFDSELKEEIAINKTTIELNELIENSFKENKTVCFETNLHIFPYKWIEEAKSLGYLIDVYFFCLNSIDIAKNRVDIRTANKGHYVNEQTIKEKWKAGYRNLNKNFETFDFIAILDNSQDLIPKFLFELERQKTGKFHYKKLVVQLPEYIERRFPDIFNKLIK